MKKTACTFISLLFVTLSLANAIIPEINILKTLNKYPKSQIFKTNFQEFTIAKDGSSTVEPQTSMHLLWNEKKLLLLKNGTGKIYEFKNNAFSRLDQTVYQGSNFGAINLISKDTVYSIGGYGFWNTSGIVKFFNQATNEWYMHQSNEYVPVAAGVNAIPYYDVKKNTLYVLYVFNGPEYITTQKSATNQIEIQALDLNTKKWLNKPKILNPNIAVQLSQISNWVPTKHGLFIQTQQEPPLVIDFSNDEVKILSENKLIEYVQSKNKLGKTIEFYSDAGLHFYNPLMDSIINIEIAPKDLSKSSIPLTIQKSETSSEIIDTYHNSIIASLAAFSFILISIIVFQHYKIKNKKYALLISKNNGSYSDFINGLMPMEWDLIKMIYENSLTNSKTTAEEINKVLGLESKPLKIQNNQRADVIFTINEKFKAKINKESDLIVRERMEEDKRLFEYSINKDVFKFISRFIENK